MTTPHEAALLATGVANTRNVEAEMRRLIRVIKIVTLLTVALLVLAGAWLVWGFSQPGAKKQPFDQQEWLQKDEIASGIGDPGCVRGGMALDLIDRKLVSGMSAQEVTALLGSPASHGSIWAYPLGQCSGFGFHNSELHVAFDDGKRVVKVVFHRVDAP